MQTLSIGKLRGFQQCTSPQGTFTALALDHRQNLRRALHPADPSQVSDADLSAFKLLVTQTLASAATAVLLDPEYSAAQAIAAGVLPGNVGLVSAVESTGYSGEPTARQGQILPGWSVAKARRMGASMVKLLVYYHPRSQSAPEIEAFVTQVAEECRRLDLGLMLEPLSYPLTAGQKLSSAEKHEVVVETARRLTPLGVDLLKAEFPLDPQESSEKDWEAACAEITAASHVPWILLSAAVDFDLFVRQVTSACRAGASGIAVGRAVWQEAVQVQGTDRSDFLRTTGRSRLVRLTALCQALGRPYTAHYSAPATPPHWFMDYPE